MSTSKVVLISALAGTFGLAMFADRIRDRFHLNADAVTEQPGQERYFALPRFGACYYGNPDFWAPIEAKPVPCTPEIVKQLPEAERRMVRTCEKESTDPLCKLVP